MEENSDSEYELANEGFPEEKVIDKALEESLSQSFVQYSPENLVPAEIKNNEIPQGDIANSNVETYTEIELIKIRDEVLALKDTANFHFKAGDSSKAMEIYTESIQLCKLHLNDLRSILYANRAACYVKISEFKEAEEDCNLAIELDSQYVKVILRRAYVREKLDKLTPALEDYKRVLELDSGQASAREAVNRLPEQILIQQEKMKEECMAKLKDLGNLVLKPFGLSTENFKMNQDPTSGGYNIQFSQDQ